MTIVLEQLSADLADALQKKAAQEGRSVEDVTVEAIARGLQTSPEKKRDLSRFRGTWVEDPAFDEAVKAFRQVDEEAKP